MRCMRAPAAAPILLLAALGAAQHLAVALADAARPTTTGNTTTADAPDAPTAEACATTDARAAPVAAMQDLARDTAAPTTATRLASAHGTPTPTTGTATAAPTTATSSAPAGGSRAFGACAALSTALWQRRWFARALALLLLLVHASTSLSRLGLSRIRYLDYTRFVDGLVTSPLFKTFVLKCAFETFTSKGLSNLD
eukprot:SAG11_NODE_1586_length_4636_cov_9.336125_7_plen_197_part_00